MARRFTPCHSRGQRLPLDCLLAYFDSYNRNRDELQTVQHKERGILDWKERIVRKKQSTGLLVSYLGQKLRHPVLKGGCTGIEMTHQVQVLG